VRPERALALLGLLVACSCGAGRERRPEPRFGPEGLPITGPPPASLTVQVDARREDTLLAVSVLVVGKSQPEREPFEDATAWQIRRVGEGEALVPTVQAPCKVLREPLDCRASACMTLWDVTVTATHYFRWPQTPGPFEIEVAVPGAARQRVSLASR
jgi:hypothetical protein